jgi:RimJ/RimL family protein N-acetyltransferase
MPVALSVPDEILTRRLRLRRHSEADVEAYQAFIADADSTRFLHLADSDRTPAGARDALLALADLYDSAAPVFSLTITLRGIDRYVGTCGFRPTAEPDTFDVFFTLVPSATGHGYATEAVAALIGHARGIGAHRLTARVTDDDRASIGVLERAGFTLAETLPDDFAAVSIYALDL